MVDRRRKWRAQHQEISIVESRGDGEYVVSGTDNDHYIVNIGALFCECLDWQKRSPKGGCKHILHVKLIEGHLEPLSNGYTDHFPAESRSSSSSTDMETLSRRTKKRDNWECQKCGARGGAYGRACLHTNHIVPKSKGGDNTMENLITVCQSCHKHLQEDSIPDGFSSVGMNDSISVRSTRDDSLNSTTNSSSKSEPKGSQSRPQQADTGRQQKLWQYQEGEHHPIDEINMPIWQSSSSTDAGEDNSTENPKKDDIEETADNYESNATPAENGNPQSETSPVAVMALIASLILIALCYVLVIILI